MLLVMVPRLTPVVKRLEAWLIFSLIRPGLAGGKNMAIPASRAAARKTQSAAFCPKPCFSPAGRTLFPETPIAVGHSFFKCAGKGRSGGASRDAGIRAAARRRVCHSVRPVTVKVMVMAVFAPGTV